MQQILCAVLLAACVPLGAQPVAVRYPEGTVHGFLALRNTEGRLLAEGDLTQTIQDDLVTLRLVFHFQDGSLDSDVCVFSQKGHFRLLRDHHIQRGPSYPTPADTIIDATHGTVTVRYLDKGRQRVDVEHVNLPDDLANGDIFDILKNISPDVAETKLSYLMATPKPRIVTLSITPQKARTFVAAGTPYKTEQLNVHIELGGLAAIVAPLLGKEPSDLNVWIGRDAVPTFFRLEGPLYLGGPTWNVTPTSPSAGDHQPSR